MAAANNKDTIYVDIDDEITTVIDKVRSSTGRIVALVLPKRATVFQSIVNMKLLKRTADSAKKHLVLVTSEAGLLPLAGAVGLHVASTPQSRPEIPQTGTPTPATDTVSDGDSGDGSDAYTAGNAGDRPVGELAGMAGAQEAMETLSLPEDEQAEDASDDTPAPASKKTKNIKVPNFNKFRLGLLLAVLLLIAVGAGLYAALFVLPKAAVDVSTKTSDINVNMTAALNPSAQVLDTSQSVLPAKVEQQQKTTTQQVAASGQQNNGATASGSVNMSAQKCTGSGFPNPIPAGTGISSNSLTFITQSQVVFNKWTGFVNGCGVASSDPVTVVAQSGGSKYNVTNATFTVAGRSDVSATGSASGGTDNIIHIVTQADIDSATQKLASGDTSSIKDSLQQSLRQDGRYPLPATFNAGQPVLTQSNKPGDQADSVTVTQAVTYTMYGAMRADLESLIKAKVSAQVDTQGQSIVNDGLDQSTVTVTDTSNGTDHITLQTTAVIGPNLQAADLKKQVAGKKVGDIKTLLGNLPGVTQVDVRLSPFWVSSAPTNLNKITVTIHGAK